MGLEVTVLVVLLSPCSYMRVGGVGKRREEGMEVMGTEVEKPGLGAGRKKGGGN